MTIHPTGFNAPNLTLVCDICGWTGTLALSALNFATKPDGTPDRHFLVLPCGNAACGSVSTHPVGGGAHPRAIQALFILKLMQHDSLTFAQAAALVKTAAEAMDGVSRFQWGQAQQVSDLVVVQP